VRLAVADTSSPAVEHPTNERPKLTPHPQDPAGLLALLLISALAVAPAVSHAAPAQVANADSGSYDLSWWTVDGERDFSTGGSYSLGGTIGQPDAGTSVDGTYTLAGGFWPGAEGVVPSPIIFTCRW